MMNRPVSKVASALVLVGLCVSATAQTVMPPAQWGDHQTGSFGEVDAGSFGETASGNFVANNFSRAEEGEVRPVDAHPTRSSYSIFRKPAAPSESPYVTLPRPEDNNKPASKVPLK